MSEFMFFTPDDLPPEVREQIERHRMEHSAASHSVYRLIDDLNDDQREALAALLRAAAGDPAMASYFCGILAAKHSADTGQCLACNRNHDEEASLLADGDSSPAGRPSEPDPANDASPPAADGSGPARPAHDRLAASSGDVVEFDQTYPNPFAGPGEDSIGTRIERMVEYHVEPLEDGNYEGRVRCLGIVGSNGPCGVTYPNLEDRMLRGPEVCSGCFARAGQG